jgi:type IV secretion system protein VirB9
MMAMLFGLANILPAEALKRTPAPKAEPPKPDVPEVELTPLPAIPLGPGALDALKVSDQWQKETASPARGADGSVVYTYGRGLPTIVCAPLRVCFLELQPGERIIGEPMIGDSVRWIVSPGLYGGVQDGTQVVIFKPQDPGLDTNLLVMTDRRPYYVRLISRENEYVARTTFRYPGEEAEKWKAQLPPAPPEEPKVLPAIIATERLNFGYSVSGGEEYMRPRRVYDDGSKTFLQMPPGIEHREAPVLVVMDADGKGVMTNYRVQQGTYIVDSLFDAAQLRLGTKKKHYVTIKREDRG